ncbi:ABC transporter permease [Paenibacillus sp. J22TS3]|uniref:ABC transporter permease n=1 Tax=Paenibacillus sp. J22TS3 TaxID=2807192 RepID=UPI001B276B1C|nr:ABC transporter permease [Paenibacillus sp. J22TS3]GIP23401.1 hypothetical protein J22TS3_36760 [Paenibacillus sp. J22TS3]
MNDTLQVALREIKTGFRNPWAYSFLLLFTIFSISLLMIHSQSFMEGYTGATGSMLNLILYLLPLMTLFLGSFSLTSEKEDGNWQLLSTYPLSTLSFITGKYIGLAAMLLAIVCFGYGVMGVVGVITGHSFGLLTYYLFVVFSIGLVLLFLAVAMVVGSCCSNRWQALTVSVSLWFFAVIGWNTLLIGFLGWLPYLWIKPVLVAMTLLNPAELVRLFVIVKLGGGSVLGPTYYRWVDWIEQPGGSYIFTGVCLVWLLVSIGLVYWIWERGRTRG